MTTVLIIVGVVVVGYLIISANGIKLFKKKEHKVKAKKSNEEKYEEVLPKEKKEKKTVKISDNVKKEKLKDDIKKELSEKVTSGVASKPQASGTVSKITKEDFMRNNIEVPSTSNLLTEEEKKAMTAKSLPKAKEQPSKPYDFGFSDFPDSPKSNFPIDDPLGSKDDPFADIDFDAILNGTSSSKTSDKPFMSENLPGFDPLDSGFGADSSASFGGFNQKTSADYFNASPSFNMSAQSDFGSEPIVMESLDERFEQVFGANYASIGGSKMGKEIIIGDILKGPRARENRARRSEREKRRKWM